MRPGLEGLFPARAGRCRALLLGSPPLRDVRFPWHATAAAAAGGGGAELESAFEVPEWAREVFLPRSFRWW